MTKRKKSMQTKNLLHRYLIPWKAELQHCCTAALNLQIESGTDKCRKQCVTTYPHQSLPVSLSSTVRMSRSVLDGGWSNDCRRLLLATKHLRTSHTQVQTIIHCAYKEKQNWVKQVKNMCTFTTIQPLQQNIEFYSVAHQSNIHFLQVHAAVLNKSWHILHFFLLILSTYTVQTDWKANSP